MRFLASIEWLATVQGEIRAVGQSLGTRFDVVMVELHDMHALHIEQILAFLALSRWWLAYRLGIREPKERMLIEVDQDLPPEIKKIDLLLVDRSIDNKTPCGGGSVFFLPTGPAVRRVEVGLKRRFVVSGPGMSEELKPIEIDRFGCRKGDFREGRT